MEAVSYTHLALNAAQVANQAKSTFLSRMSHDIRTPMNAIIGLTAIAASCADDPDRVIDCLGKITSSSKLLLSLINEVLDMSKIESGRIVLSEEDFLLDSLFKDVISMIQPDLKLSLIHIFPIQPCLLFKAAAFSAASSVINPIRCVAGMEIWRCLTLRLRHK